MVRPTIGNFKGLRVGASGSPPIAPPPSGGGGGSTPETGYQFPSVTTFNSSVSPEFTWLVNSGRWYWKAATGSSSIQVLCRFRRAGTNHWYQGFPGEYDARGTVNPQATTAARRFEYRSAVWLATPDEHVDGLRPNTTYDVQLLQPVSGEFTSGSFTTWPDPVNLPVAQTINVSSIGGNYTINTGGTETGYVKYKFPSQTGGTYTITVNDNARYVIIEGLDDDSTVFSGPANSCINVQQLTDSGTMPTLVIRKIRFTNYGRQAGSTGYGLNYESAIKGRNNSGLYQDRWVVERCTCHDPRWPANSWAVNNINNNGHPEGPQFITLEWTQRGLFCVRYNTVYSSANKKFNDIIGGTQNNSFAGFPCKDSDIYKNDFSYCWDDAFELEGANCNILVFRNKATLVFNYFANASTSIGPIYFSENIGITTEKNEIDNGIAGEDLYEKGTAQKGRDPQSNYGGGRIYWFFNTFPRLGAQTAAARLDPASRGCAHGLYTAGGNAINFTAKNNVVQAFRYATFGYTDASNTFAKNILNGGQTSQLPAGQSGNNWTNTPVYVNQAGGDYTLASNSTGYAAGEIIPMFTPTYVGALPDIGYRQHGVTPFTLGRNG